MPAVADHLSLEYSRAADMIGLPGEFIGLVTYQHVGSSAADVANSYELTAYHVVNARLTWQRKVFSVYIFANNLLDERNEAWGQSF